MDVLFKHFYSDFVDKGKKMFLTQNNLWCIELFKLTIIQSLGISVKQKNDYLGKLQDGFYSHYLFFSFFFPYYSSQSFNF